MIPRELQQRKQWICWKYEQIPGRSKPTKVPYDPVSGYKAKSTDRTTWTDFDTAVKTLPDTMVSDSFLLRKTPMWV